MKKKRKGVLRPLLWVTTIISVSVLSLTSCDEEGNFELPLTETEIIQGLKEALKVGTDNSVAITNRTGGYYDNELIKIPWPEEASGAYNFIDSNIPELRPVLDEVVLKMNRGAEEASAKAKPIFIDAVMAMTIEDAREILNGADNAATMYLHEKTYESLHAAFKPDIHDALESVGAATAWSNITNTYNPIAQWTPGIDPINTDLADYTTTQALDGLFLLLAEEELKIRTDPLARINDILERVFGTLD